MTWEPVVLRMVQDQPWYGFAECWWWYCELGLRVDRYRRRSVAEAAD